MIVTHHSQVDYSFLIGVHRIRINEFEDVKLRKTLSLEFDILNAVAGGEDDHSQLRYRFGFVDITRTMTPMVRSHVIDLNCSESFAASHVIPQKTFLGSLGRFMGGKTVQEPNSYAKNLIEILDLATE
jgi:hypothetical protein